MLLVALVGALLAVVVTWPGTLPGATAYLTVSIGGACAAWYGRLRRGGRRGAVPWVALTLTFNAIGDVLWQVLVWTAGTAPAPSCTRRWTAAPR